MGFFSWNTWKLGDLGTATGDRPIKAGSCTVEFQGKQYELKTETLHDKLKSILRRSHVNTYYVIFKFKVTSDTGHSHLVYIRTLPQLDPNGPAQVYCDCPDFKYRSAYGLQRHGSLFRSAKTDAKLGESITVAPKNKSGTTVLCKHALAAVQDLYSNFNTYIS